MNTRYALWLNNQGLHDLDERIIITDVQESAPRMRTVTAANAHYDGQRVTRRTRQSLSLTVSFLIREYDTARRKHLCSTVCAWANTGGWLTISDRPGQRLRVCCETLPAVSSSLRWTEPLTITFTAWEMPFWQDESPVRTFLSVSAGKAASAVIRPHGDAPCTFLEGSFTNTGTANVSSLTIAAGSSVFHLNDPALIPPGATLTIGYDDNLLLYIRTGDASMLHARSADSSDDLTLTPGRPCAVSITGSQNLSVTLQARGLYL